MEDQKIILNHQVEVVMKQDHLHSCWFALRQCIDNEVPTDPADMGFLMEVMGDVAKQDKNTKKDIKLKLNLRKMRGVWYCLRCAVENDLFKNLPQKIKMLESQSLLSVEMDKVLALFATPEQNDEKPVAGGLKLVK